MIAYPCAKINLGLNIVTRRSDGYHDLETIFYPVKLYDRLEINVLQDDNADKGLCLLTNNGIEIAGEVKDNLVVKAYNAVKQKFPDIPSVNIKLTKNIPSQAGMGGGSSDCTFTITILNEMFNLGMSVSDIQIISSKLGADCPFFANPVPSFATGIGERLMPISLNLADYCIGIVKPPIMISTREAFAHVVPRRPSQCCMEIVKEPIENWRGKLINDFEESIAAVHPEIYEIKQRLYEIGAVYSAMSGSGSAVYGIFKERPQNLDSVFNECFTAIV